MVGRQVAAGAAYRVAAPQIGAVDGGSQRQVLAWLEQKGFAQILRNGERDGDRPCGFGADARELKVVKTGNC